MALYKIRKSIDFKAGLNEGLAESSIVGELLKAENFVITRFGEFEPRKGFTALPAVNAADVKVEKLVSFNGMIRGFSKTAMYLYVNAADNNVWVYTGSLTNIQVKTISINSGYASYQSNPWHAYGASLVCLTYNKDGKTYYDIVTKEGKIVLSSQLITDTTANAKVLYKAGYFIILFVEGTDLSIKVLAERNPSNATDITLVNDATGTFQMFDYTAKWLGLLYKSSATGNLVGLYFDKSGNIATLDDKIQEKTDTGVAIGDATFFSSSKDVAISFEVATQQAGDVSFIELDQQFNVVQNIIVDSGNSALHTPTIAHIENDIFVLATYPGVENYIVKHLVGGGSETLVRGLALASNVFSYNDRAFVLATSDVQFQRSVLILDVATGLPEGRVEYLTGTGHLEYLLHCDGSYVVTPTTKKLIRENETFLADVGLNLNIISNNSVYQTQEYGNSLFISGSLAHLFDGTEITEHGFLFYPYGVEVTGSVGSGGLQSEKSYFYQVCYAWYDGNGLLHRSAPSQTVSLDTAGGIDTATLTIPTLRVTKKKDVAIEIYRSEADGATNYKLVSVPNDPTVDTVTFVDESPDSVVLGKEPLYTEGGVLANAALDTCGVMTTHQNRLFAVSQRDGKKIAYSHERAPGFPAEFTDYMTVALPLKEDIKAIHGLGDYLLVFTEHSIGVVTGVGADPIGTGATFNFEYLSQDVGCSIPSSLIESNKGVYFKSSKGIYLVSKGGGLDFVGQAVKTRDFEITDAVALTDKNEIRFFGKNGTLILHEEYGVWTTATIKALSVVYHMDKIHLIDADNDLLVENNGFSDKGDSIVTRLQTGWLALADLAGFQRIYKVILSGLTKGSHSVTINVYYDGKRDTPASTFHQEYTDDSTEWGDITWGSTLQESESGNYDVSLRLGRKCESISVEAVIEGIDNKPTGQASISSITLEYGIKRGLQKKSRSRRVTG